MVAGQLRPPTGNPKAPWVMGGVTPVAEPPAHAQGEKAESTYGEGRVGGGKNVIYTPETGGKSRPNTGRCKHATLRGRAEGNRNVQTLPLECPHGSPSADPPK